ncbi:MAG: hypothetical protein JO100_18595 [Pseudonocardia sp.]|nr:hypothetical protein [Pseudonocardia sp.]
MPTLTITGAALSRGRKHRAAIRITRWFTHRDVPAHRVVIRFVETDHNEWFSAGVPLSAMAQGPDLHSGMVLCQIDPNRDRRSRDELAIEVADALGVGPSTRFFYLEFQPTTGTDVRIAVNGALEYGAASTTHRDHTKDEEATL